MYYTIEDWWNAQLATLLHAGTFTTWTVYHVNKFLRGLVYPTSASADTFDIEMQHAIDAHAKKVRTGRHNTTTYRCRNMITLGGLLGYSKEASLWLAFAAHVATSMQVVASYSLEAMDMKGEWNWVPLHGEPNLFVRDKMLQQWSGLNVKHLRELENSGLLRVFKWHSTVENVQHDSILLDCSVGLAPAYTSLLTNISGQPLSRKDLLQLFITGMPKSRLRGSDFQHVQHTLAADYLVGAAKDPNTKGANVLVYGPPGTGKTEFVRWLATTTGLSFFTASPMTDKASDTLQRALTSCAFMQHRRGDVLVIDEAEDVFTSTNYARASTPSRDALSKGNLNVFLETHEIPIVWICNQRHIIDPAVRRRCDIVIEIDKLPRAARLKSIRKHTHGLKIAAAWKRQLSRNDDITMADIGSACRAVKVAGNRAGEAAARDIEDVLRAKLKDREKSVQVLPRDKPATLQYRLDYCNVDVPLDQIQRQFQRGRQGRFCLYGPPGTGKTEFVRQTAHQHNRRLIEKPASALLGMYVGQTEKNIAEAFVEADDQDAILLIDEADSFLRNREGARQSWEVQHVNELLVQMEKFDGTLICCSNLIDNIDPAAFRRFDMKIKFDFMKSSQVLAMLTDTVGPVDHLCSRRCSKLRYCTPGDFAAAIRRFSFLDQVPTANELLQQLEREIGFKPENRTGAIGFEAK